jgi:beta-mannanase
MSTTSNVNSTPDRRLNWQLIVLSLLTLLPIVMIAFNGYRAARMIFSSAGPQVVSQPQTTVSASSVSAVSRPRPLRFGVHDPEGVFANDSQLAIRHLFVSWVDFDAEQLKRTLHDLEKRGLTALVTIEPWPKKESNEPLLEAIASGGYDAEIDRISDALGSTSKPIMVCWGHEMDQDIATRYPWSGQPPKDYVRAYCYVVQRVKDRSKASVQWVWAGVLKKGSGDYWPGDDCVDFIGMPIYSFPQWDSANYGYIRHFRKTFEEKRSLVRQFDKPLMITELGVNGSDDFESFWMHQAFLALDDFPELDAVLFFHAKDKEGAWGEKWGAPDWRLHPETIRGLVQWKLETSAASESTATAASGQADSH